MKFSSDAYYRLDLEPDPNACLKRLIKVAEKEQYERLLDEAEAHEASAKAS